MKYGIELVNIHSVTVVINCHISRVNVFKNLSFRDEKRGGLGDGYLIITSRRQTQDAVLFMASVTLQLIKLRHKRNLVH